MTTLPRDVNELTLPQLWTRLTEGGFLSRLLAIARDEDLGIGGRPGDVTSWVMQEPAQLDKVGTADLVARSPGIAAGLAAIPAILNAFAPNVRVVPTAVADGSVLERGMVIASLTGPEHEVLAAERTLLNLVSRLSGIATRTHMFLQQLRGTSAQLLDTRKTTPGLRMLEKYAVRCGGGHCHRLGLFDAVLVKDNHIAHLSTKELPDVMRRAVAKARGLASSQQGIQFFELEVDRLDQFHALLQAGLCVRGTGIDIILLDNMSQDLLREAVRLRDAHQSDVLLESSGGITLETIGDIARTGVDRISVGGLTHQAVSLDLGLDMRA